MNTKELRERSADIEALNRALVEDKQLLDSGRFKEVEVSGLVYKEGVINGGDWEGVTLHKPHFENMTFEGVDFTHVVIEGGIFRNVTFRNCSFKIQRDVWDGSNFFRMDEMTNIIMDGISGNDLDFYSENSTESDNRLLVKNSKFIVPSEFEGPGNKYSGRGLTLYSDFDSILIVNSQLSKARIKNSQPANQLIIKDSTIKRSSFSSRELVKHYIVLDSEVHAGSPLKADVMYVRGSSIDVGFPNSKIVIVKESKNILLGMDSSSANLLYVDGCTGTDNGIYMGESSVNRLIVKNCDLKKFNYYLMKGNELTLCNVTLGKTDFEDTHLKNAYWQNVHLNGPIDLTNARIGTLHSHEVSGEEDVWQGLASFKVGRNKRCTEPMEFPEVEATVADAEQRVAELLEQLGN